MKRLLVLICLIFIVLSFSGCDKENTNSSSSAPEVTINMPDDDTVNGYRTEEKISDTETPDSISGDDVGTADTDNIINNTSKEFCGNKNSKVFHYISCGSVSKMSEHNKYFADRDTLISEGYKPCGSCKP